MGKLVSNRFKPHTISELHSVLEVGVKEVEGKLICLFDRFLSIDCLFILNSSHNLNQVLHQQPVPFFI